MTTWFHWVENWGYAGVFILMAMESSILPVPSEIVMPPAAFWAAQGRMDFWGVVLAGTAGSYFGSVVSYFTAQWAGAPLIRRYGKFFFFSAEKFAIAENWIRSHGVFGVFFARLLPVVRHLVSIPAGVFRMSFGKFSAATITGAAIWCTLLSWFGREVIGDSPELLQSPEQLILVMKAKMIWIIGGVLVLMALYGVMASVKRRSALRRA